MRILIDINHPADVHFFKYFIKIMNEKGHKILVIARDRDVVFKLLESNNIEYIDRGQGYEKIFKKILYMFLTDIKIYKHAKKFNPDLFISFSSPYASQVAMFMKKPHIAFNDTEHTDKIHKVFSYPFSEAIVTPLFYYHTISEKQIRFNGYMELSYLHPNYFIPDGNILRLLGLAKNEKFFLIRFVSWNAFHDIGQKGLSIENKRALIEKLNKHGKVFISSEGNLPNEFLKYQIKISPDKIHHLLYYADFLISESATMASESSILGTPVIYVNSLPLMGYLNDEKENGLLFHINDAEMIFDKIDTLLSDEYLKENAKVLNHNMLKDKIDVTAFMIWLIENYPESIRIMKKNPEYQDRFR